MIQKLKNWICSNEIEYKNSALNKIILLELEIVELKKQIDELENLYISPLVMDSNYWNTKWKQAQIYYDYGHGNNPIDILNQITEEDNILIDKIVDNIIKDYDITCVDDIPLIVMKWRWEYFKYNTGYISDKQNYGIEEYWAPVGTTLKTKEYECDDIAIVEYCIIRSLIKKLYNWDEHRHRLKFVAGNVNDSSGRYVGGHAYLLWLYKDCKWYTIESTYRVVEAIDNYSILAHKYNQCYGVMWFSCNDQYSWSQFNVEITRKDLTK